MTELPTTFGKYFLTEKLATGGMAEIYLAKLMGPGGFEKQLVLKQIHPKLSGQRHFVDLFVAEAKMLVTLAHGNIVPVYELGVVDDTYFIAMEYIDGPTLYRLTEALARREVAMEPALAAWITARVVEGLDYAHRKGDGLIHRDLSPRNVMLSRDGEVKLVDFGIAVTLGDPGEHASAGAAPTGSFPYMSPEQVRREPLTGQTDLFTVGVLLWEMLAGRRLFARGDADATLAAVLGGDIARPSTIRADVPAKLDDVVMRALERDRDVRWQTAADMLAALNRYLYGLDDTPTAREVAALVARFCPPETRRLPTEAEGLGVIDDERSGPNGADAGDATIPRMPDDDAAAVAPIAPVASGPRTAVIARDGAPQGKRPRQQSFATHVQLKDMLERATPLFGFDAIRDEPVDPVTGAAVIGRASSAAEGELTTEPPAPPDDDSAIAVGVGAVAPRATTARPRTAGRDSGRNLDDSNAPAPPPPSPSRAHVPGRAPPSRQLLVLAGLGGLGLATAAVVMFLHGRAAVDAPDDAALIDARTGFIVPPAIDAGDSSPVIDAGDAPTTIDAATAMSTSIDAGAGVAASRDGGSRTRPDADRSAPPLDATAARARDAATIAADVDAAPIATGTATLKIGAVPWAKVFVDGVKRGSAPLELTVGAGHHTVELVFDPPDDTPHRHAFEIDPAAGATLPLEFDFTHAP